MGWNKETLVPPASANAERLLLVQGGILGRKVERDPLAKN
jgi:hypothetical protein